MRTLCKDDTVALWELHDSMHEAMGSTNPKTVANATRQNYHVMLNEINPTEVRNKWGVPDFVSQLDACEQPLPVLRWLAERYGYVLVAHRASGREPEGMLESLTRVTKEGGDVAAALLAALGDGRISDPERRAVQREIDEQIAALERLREAVQEAA